MILDQPPPNWKRPGIPLGAQVLVLKRALAKLLGCDEIEVDHRPPLSARKFDTETNDTIPPANDVSSMQAIAKRDHAALTYGPGGEKRITTAGSDANVRAKTTRIRKAMASLIERGVMPNQSGAYNDKAPKPRSRWPSRKFPSRKRDK